VARSVAVIYSHPYPNRSRAGRALLEGLRGLPSVDVRVLYSLYPDFDIDVAAEQRALVNARLIVWMHPMFWYSVPALLKHWFDKVLARGFAYGQGGTALSGKRCLWVVTTGGDEASFGAEGMHRRPLEEFSPVIEQTALFCGMRWEPPLVLHGAHRVADSVLEDAADEYRARLEQLVGDARGSGSASSTAPRGAA